MIVLNADEVYRRICGSEPNACLRPVVSFPGDPSERKRRRPPEATEETVREGARKAFRSHHHARRSSSLIEKNVQIKRLICIVLKCECRIHLGARFVGELLVPTKAPDQLKNLASIWLAYSARLAFVRRLALGSARPLSIPELFSRLR